MWGYTPSLLPLQKRKLGVFVLFLAPFLILESLGPFAVVDSCVLVLSSRGLDWTFAKICSNSPSHAELKSQVQSCCWAATFIRHLFQTFLGFRRRRSTPYLKPGIQILSYKVT